jgi:hypothetical protein
MVAQALAWGLPASRAAANSTTRSRSRVATSWPRLNAARFKVTLRRQVGALATACRSRATPPAHSCRPGR